MGRKRSGQSKSATPAATGPSEVFLSHSHADRKFTSELASGLRRHDVATWYSERNIAGAKQWHDEIGAALSRCDWMVVVLTPSSVRSKWVKRELVYALNSDRYDERVIPLVVTRCDFAQLSWTLSSLQMITFAKRPRADAMRELLRIWGIGYRD